MKSEMNQQAVGEFVNTSGMGKDAVLPDGVAGWSWGAFFWTWLWAIFNRTYIGLLFFVPYVGILIAPLLGIYGREWAWRNKRWDSLEHFNWVQRRWSIWGWAILSLILLGLVAFYLIIAAGLGGL